MHLTNFHFYNSKNYLYNKLVKGLQGCGLGYRFSFNGKENDNETQTQDYGMRIYDNRLGRFLSVDPLTKSYPMLTPYQFASNTPVQAIDLDGLEACYYTISFDSKGKSKLQLISKTEGVLCTIMTTQTVFHNGADYTLFAELNYGEHWTYEAIVK